MQAVKIPNYAFFSCTSRNERIKMLWPCPYVTSGSKKIRRQQETQLTLARDPSSRGNVLRNKSVLLLSAVRGSDLRSVAFLNSAPDTIC